MNEIIYDAYVSWNWTLEIANPYLESYL
jgi:hypothetical protein